MDKFNLFSLLGVKLLENNSHLTMNIYNVLFEILVERMAHQIITDPHPQFNGQELIIQNSGELFSPYFLIYTTITSCLPLLVASL